MSLADLSRRTGSQPLRDVEDASTRDCASFVSTSQALVHWCGYFGHLMKAADPINRGPLPPTLLPVPAVAADCEVPVPRGGVREREGEALFRVVPAVSLHPSLPRLEPPNLPVNPLHPLFRRAFAREFSFGVSRKEEGPFRFLD